MKAQKVLDDSKMDQLQKPFRRTIMIKPNDIPKNGLDRKAT